MGVPGIRIGFKILKYYSMISTKELIAYFHLVTTFILGTYFFWGNIKFDRFYILIFMAINISWVVLSNECIITYFYKKIHDSNYEIGTSIDLDDFSLLVGEQNAKYFIWFLRASYALSLLVVLYRSKFNNTVNIALLAAFISYIFYIASAINDVHVGLTRTIHGLICFFLFYNVYIS